MQDWTGNKNSVYKTLGASNHTDKERQRMAVWCRFALQTLSPYHDRNWQTALYRLLPTGGF